MNEAHARTKLLKLRIFDYEGRKW